MTRDALLAMGVGRRGTFYGTFTDQWRIRSIPGNRVRKMFLLKDVRGNGGQPLCEHLWFFQSKAFRELGLSKGDVVRFRATVKKYHKRVRTEADIRGEVYTVEDYKLAYPTDVQKVGDPTKPMLDAGQVELLSFIQ